MFKEPVIQTRRAGESWIMGLVAMGILEVTENGIMCRENVPASGRGPGQGQHEKAYAHYKGMEREKQVGIFRTCEYCGAHLDPGEPCGCREEGTAAGGCRPGTGTAPDTDNPYKEETTDVTGKEH